VPGHLAQVVTNLVTNAIDASAVNRGSAVRLVLGGDDSGLWLRVADSGCGMPAEVMAKVFEPLFTTKPFGEGTGLGLSIVHDIVTGHFGGEIKVKSEMGRGTTFEVSFPRQVPRPAAAGALGVAA
jgi:signal transduction histidine kinase